jgi:hypothetical protein
MPPVRVSARTTAAARVEATPGGGFTMRLPEADPSGYALAQLDDYMELPRGQFRWQAPTTLRLRARLAAEEYAGTWGFGLWNDPFTASLGVAGTARRLPVLPNAAWFFFASAHNHLALRDDQPGSGFLAATFSSPRLPSLLLAPGLLGLPFLGWRQSSRWLRRLARGLIGGDGKSLDVDGREWHEYAVEWSPEIVGFVIDRVKVFETEISPIGPLGIVIWLDNQFAAWRPNGTVSAGRLMNRPAMLEIAGLEALAGRDRASGSH